MSEEKNERSLAKKKSTPQTQVLSNRISKKLKPKLEYTLDLVSQGISKKDIIKSLSDHFDITEGSAENIYQASFKWLQTTSKDERMYLKEKHEAMLMNLYRLNIERGNFKEAHLVLQTLNKMFGIDRKDPERAPSQNTFEFKFNIAPTHVEMVSVDPIDVDIIKDDDE